MAKKTIMLNFFVYLILVHNFGLTEVSGKNNIQAPPNIPRVLLRNPQAPSIGNWYRKNDEEDGKGDAFRPTRPGHSPGVGHDAPPNRP